MLLGFLLAICGSPQVAAAETLTFACSPGSEERNDSNLMKELTQMTAEAAGYKVKFVDYPWARVVSMLKAGAITGSHCLSYIDDRKDWVTFFPVPFHQNRLRFFKVPSNPLKYESIEQLLKLSIVVHKESYIAHIMESIGAENLQLVYDGHTLCNMLKAKRVDLMVMAGNTQMSCHENFQETKTIRVPVEPIGPYFYDESLQLGISKKFSSSKELTENLYTAFKGLVKQGEVDAVYKKYKAAMPESVVALK